MGKELNYMFAKTCAQQNGIMKFVTKESLTAFYCTIKSTIKFAMSRTRSVLDHDRERFDVHDTDSSAFRTTARSGGAMFETSNIGVTAF
jgi:hypothetical protein